MQYWLYLTGAIVLEAAGTTSMKLSDGFASLVPSVFIFVFYAASFVALTFALKGIDLSLAYAIWSGVGTVIVATIGILHFQEQVTVLKIASIGLIISGVVGLKLSGVGH